MKNEIINVQGVDIKITTISEEDYISLTDMTAHFDGGSDLILAWLRNKNTVEFLGIWESINNPDFNSVEFEGIKNEAGLNRFSLSIKKWNDKVNGIGLIAKAGRYGGTYAHKDIAFEFGSWLSPEFKLYLIKEFQRLKEQEAQSEQQEWSIRRTLAKAQYHVHTDAVKNHIIPALLTQKEIQLAYANEADILNKALFGCTAKQWREQNPDKKGNIRDYATIEQLIVLSGLEAQNAVLIEQGKNQAERLTFLNAAARKQLTLLLDKASVKQLSGSQLLEE